MAYLVRLACATGIVLASALSNLHAAPVCSSIAGGRPVVVPAARTAAAPAQVAQACAQNCELAGLQNGEPLAMLPAPTHLPVVSSPEEVAAWHAEIFEQLAESRGSAARTQVCQLDGRPSRAARSFSQHP
jgi:hypothetical protein